MPLGTDVFLFVITVQSATSVVRLPGKTYSSAQFKPYFCSLYFLRIVPFHLFSEDFNSVEDSKLHTDFTLTYSSSMSPMGREKKKARFPCVNCPRMEKKTAF